MTTVKHQYGKITLGGSLLLLVLLAWSLTTPVLGYPDGPFHIANIWCDDGVTGFRCERVDGEPTRMVPNAFHDGNPWWGTTGLAKIADRSESVYPGLFYSTMRIFAGDNVVRSAYIMRVFNSILATVMLVGAMVLLPRRLRLAFGASWLAGGAALGFFYLSSEHPLGWLYLGAGTCWAYLVAVLGSHSVFKRLVAVTGFIVSIALTLGSRPEGPAALAVSLLVGVAAWLTSDQWKRTVGWLRGWGRGIKWLVGGAVISVAVILTGAVSRATLINRIALDSIRNELRTGFWNELVEVPYLYFLIGGSNSRFTEEGYLGPHSVPLILAISGTALLGFRRLWLGKSLALVLVVAGLVLAPFAIQVDYRGIFYTPPRYLVAFLILALAALLLDDGGLRENGLRNVWIAIGLALIVGHSLALHTAFQPYLLGTTPPQWQLGLNAGRKWWWSVGPSPQSAWLVGSVAMGALLVLFAKETVLSKQVDAR